MDTGTLAAIAFAAVAVLVFMYASWQFISPERSASERLAEFTGGPSAEGGTTRLSSFTRSAAKLAAGTDTELVQLRKWLVQAGFRQRTAPELYGAARTIGLVFGGLVGFLLVLLLHKSPPPTVGAEAEVEAAAVTLSMKMKGLSWYLAGLLGGAALGYYAPYLYVSNALQKRKSKLIVAFPDALDLLVSAVEAGLGLDAGFRRVADEMEIASPELAQELQLVNHEVVAGVPRVDALRQLEERVGLDDVTSLVNVLIQSERFGSSVSRALRVHGQHIRVKRMQRAETKAAQVSPKLTVIMILFILPTLLIILLGPAAIKMKNILLPTAENKGLVE